MARVIVINTEKTFAHLYLTLNDALRDTNLNGRGTLETYYEDGKTVYGTNSGSAATRKVELDRRLQAVLTSLLAFIKTNPPSVQTSPYTTDEARDLVMTYVKADGVPRVELFTAYPSLIITGGNFIHNWLHH